MTKDLVKGYDNHIILRIKYTDGSYYNLAPDDPNRGKQLRGIRVFLFNKFRIVVLKFGIDIYGDEWRTRNEYERITKVDEAKGLIGLRLNSIYMMPLLEEGPWFLRATLVYDDVNYSGGERKAIPNELLHGGYVIGENTVSFSPDLDTATDEEEQAGTA